MKTILAAFLAISCVAWGDDIKTTDGRDYKGVTISRVEPDGIMVVTDSGIEKIPFTSLPDEVARKYGYDAGKAAQFQNALSQAAAAQAQQARLDRANEAAAKTQEWQDEQAKKPVLVSSQPAFDNPLDHASTFTLRGEVTQRMKDGMIVSPSNLKFSVVFVKIDPSISKFYEGDAFKSPVVRDGDYSYTQVSGAESVIPQFKVGG